MAEQKKLTTAEIIALARKGSSGIQPTAETDPSAEPREANVQPNATAEPPAAPNEPAVPPKSAAPKSGERPSVADVLAMARAGKSAAAAPEKPAATPEAAKPTSTVAKAAVPAAAKPAATAPAAKDTASILAAARAQARPGPMTKAEAAARQAPVRHEPVAKAKSVVPPMPPKPDYAKPQRVAAKAAAVDAEDRRGFLSVMLGSMMGIGFVALSATAGLWTLGFARFMFPNILTEPPSKFKVGFPESFSPGTVEERFKAQYGVWVVNAEYAGQQELFALRTVCTHLGCTPNWLEAEQKFKCPCHGSGFYKDGINFEGPAPRPLERYAIRVAEDGQVEIDKSRMFQEEKGQWNDPGSFVARTA